MIKGLEAFLWKQSKEIIDFQCGKLKAKQGCLKKWRIWIRWVANLPISRVLAAEDPP